MVYGGSFLHIASELEDVGWLRFSIRDVLLTIVGSHKFSFFCDIMGSSCKA